MVSWCYRFYMGRTTQSGHFLRTFLAAPKADTFFGHFFSDIFFRHFFCNGENRRTGRHMYRQDISQNRDEAGAAQRHLDFYRLQI